MSRDQRPGRAVLVDSGPNSPGSVGPAATIDGPLPVPVPVPVDRRPLLWSIMFLLACIVGAIAVAVLLPGTSG